MNIMLNKTYEYIFNLKIQTKRKVENVKMVHHQKKILIIMGKKHKYKIMTLWTF